MEVSAKQPIISAEEREALSALNAAAAAPETPSAQAAATPSDILWLGRRIMTATACKGSLPRRERKRLGFIVKQEQPDAPLKAVMELSKVLKLRLSRWRDEVSEEDLPVVAYEPGQGYRFVYERSMDGVWLAESPEGRVRVTEWPAQCRFYSVQVAEELSEEQTATGLFNRIFSADKGWMYQAAIASTLGSILVLGTSLYTMQVYDRVIGQGGLSTLVVLTIGVMIAILTEFGIKVARSSIVDKAVNHIDIACSKGVFERMQRVRLDQFPASVGTLAAQVRGFETVRGFRTARSLYLLTDAPFALFFLFVIYLLGGPLVASVPAVAFVVAVLVGFSFRRAIQKHSARMDLVGNRKQGLLVEAIQGSELIKSSGAAWRIQGRWNELSHQSSDESMEVKSLNDMAGYFAASIQQISYVGLVAVGAYVATSTNELSVGAIIACSIVSGRVLTPVNQIPGLLVQWAHARVAMDNLEKLFELQCDNHGVNNPIFPEVIKGGLNATGLEFAYPGQATPMKLGALSVKPGEKVAILGGIGTGKTTLLKLLSGLMKPERGQVLLDGVDLQQIDLERRSEAIGYLPQATRLISGTLRENLTLGLPHVSDDYILKAAEATGLSVLLASRPEGLDIRITEGGEGLSGGQKQLVGLTRVLLGDPTLWLLDEPTASMDDATEDRCLRVLKQAIRADRTLVLVTHKFRLLELVDRVIVLTPEGIAMDGPRDSVIAQLQQRAMEMANAKTQAHAQPAAGAVNPAQAAGQPSAQPAQPTVRVIPQPSDRAVGGQR